MGAVYNTMIDAWDFKSDPYPQRLFYVCPHCHNEVDQKADNFHFWCDHCGRNATSEVGGTTGPVPSGEWSSQSLLLDGIWHRILIKTADRLEMRCGYRVGRDDGEEGIYPDSFTPESLYCPTCFYVA